LLAAPIHSLPFVVVFALFQNPHDGTFDQPIAIRALKRFVCERYGVESMADLRS
jgi:hypothetical protein